MYTLSHDGASEYWIPGYFLQKENSEDDKGGGSPDIFFGKKIPRMTKEVDPRISRHGGITHVIDDRNKDKE